MQNLFTIPITILFWLMTLPFAILALPYFIIVSSLPSLTDTGAKLYFDFYKLHEWFKESTC